MIPQYRHDLGLSPKLMHVDGANFPSLWAAPSYDVSAEACPSAMLSGRSPSQYGILVDVEHAASLVVNNEFVVDVTLAPSASCVLAVPV